MIKSSCDAGDRMVEDGCFFVPVEERVLPFGRYRGKCLGSIPSGYLKWLACPLSPSQQAQATTWAQLARRVLRNRSAFQGHVDNDFEKLEQTAHIAEISSFSDKHVQNADILHSCPEPATLASVLQRSDSSQNCIHGWEAHHHILLRGLEQHTLLKDFILKMYSDCGAFYEAETNLTSLEPKNVIPWNRMIKAYMRYGYVKKALELFELMFVKEIEPNIVTLLFLFDLCGKHTLVHEGRLTHHSMMDIDLSKDVVIGNSLITMYGKCRSLDDVRNIFEKMNKMKQEGYLPDEVTYVSILDACANLSNLPEGHRLHTHVLALHLESSVIVGSALVSMYGKCSKPDDAFSSFQRISQKNTVCWTAMISAYAQNGRGKDALELFSMMEQQGVHPNRVTIVSVLDACATSANLSLGEMMFGRLNNSGLSTAIKSGWSGQ